MGSATAVKKQKPQIKKEAAEYKVWVQHDSTPTRVVAGPITMAQAAGFVRQARKDLAANSNISYAIEYTRTGRFIQF